MKRKIIEKRLSSAVSKIAPEKNFERLVSEIDSAPIKNEGTVIKMTENKKTFKNYARVAIAACLVIAVGLLGISYYGNNLAVDSIVDLDINPSIELSTNKQEKVIKVVAFNEEANAIIDGMDLKNTDLKVAINAILGSMVKQGYLEGLDNGILVTVTNEDTVKAENLQKELAVNIDETLKTYNVEASVIKQTVSNTNDAEAMAKELNISLGKAHFIQNLIAKDNTLKAEDLAKMSVKELAQLVQKNNIDISDIADYEADDSVWENIADSIEEVDENAVNPNENTNTNTKPDTNADKISAEKAKQIALNHAGVSADKAKFLKAELKLDDGIYEYDVEFKVGNYEYDYEIHAVSGKILDYSKELDDDVAQKPTPKPETTTVQNSNRISASKAKTIALNHAGFTAKEVSFLKAELDFDDGIYKYEVEFVKGNMDYEYEINAESGKIIKSEKEPVDFD